MDLKIEELKLIETDLKRRRIPADVKRAVSIMLDKKAERIVVLKMKDLTDITDYMIVCHGNSSRQNKAISDEIQVKLREEFKLKPFGVEGVMDAEWILLDYVDFVIHIFSEENRKKYAIEKLWMDAKRYNFYPGSEPAR
ncbi:MAG: ribosome silencing factor [Candidatus Omnitrophota bacterium]